MPSKRKQNEKARLHLRNKNRKRYDLNALMKVAPDLKNHIILNKYGVESVDFSKSKAVKLLNTAILKHYYGIKNWDFPNENLCPPIPGRADYIHYMADLLAENNFGEIPTGDKITCLDIGIGASCIYPILGVSEYEWNFIGSDIDPKTIESSQSIVNSNPQLKKKVECRLQKNSSDILYGILDKSEKVDLTICNPPFHSSTEEAEKGTRRKILNLTGKKVKNPKLNFAGIESELIYDGGEYKFLRNMIRESKKFSENCLWFSSLVSKQSNLKRTYSLLQKNEAIEIKTIPMGTGNKSSRIVAWTFLSKEQRKEWREIRWKKGLK